MKHNVTTRSLLLITILLLASVLGMLVLGTQAAPVQETYTVDVAGTGEKNYATIADALAAAAGSAGEWASGSSLTISVADGTYTEATPSGIFFGVPTIFTADGSRLPITIEGASQAGTILGSEAAKGAVHCTNDYTFKNLTLCLNAGSTGANFYTFYAGSGEVVLDTVLVEGGTLRFAGDTSSASVFEGWEQENFDKEKDGKGLLPVGISFKNTVYNAPNAATWSHPKIMASDGAYTNKYQKDTLTIGAEQLHSHIIALEGADLTRINGIAPGDRPKYPGWISLKVLGGTVKGVAADNGTSVGFSSGNGGNNMQTTAKTAKADILVDGGTVNSCGSYGIVGITNSKYSADSQINITIKSGTVNDIVAAVGGAAAAGDANNWYDGKMETAGTFNLLYQSGTADLIYGVRSPNAYNCHEFSGTIHLVIDGDYSGKVYGLTSLLGTDTKYTGSDKPAPGVGPVLAKGGKIIIEAKSGTLANTSVVRGIEGGGGVVQDGAELAMNITGATVGGRFHLAVGAAYDVQSGGTLSATLSGGVMKSYLSESSTNRYATLIYGGDRTVTGLKAGSKIKINLCGTDFSSCTGYVALIHTARVESDVEINVSHFNTTGNFRWCWSSDFYGKTQITADTTVDGWGGSTENKEGASIYFKSLWPYQSGVYGTGETRIDGGDSKNIDIDLMYGVTAHIIKNEVKNASVYAYYSNRGHAISTATTYAEGIQEIHNTLTGVILTGTRTTTNDTTKGAGFYGSGNRYNQQTVHGTVYNTFEDCDATNGDEADATIICGSYFQSDTNTNIVNLFKGNNQISTFEPGSTTGKITGNLTTTFSGKYGKNVLKKIPTHGALSVGGNVTLKFDGNSHPTNLVTIEKGAGAVKGAEGVKIVIKDSTFGWHVVMPEGVTIESDNGTVNGYFKIKSNTTMTQKDSDFKYGIYKYDANVTGTHLTTENSVNCSYGDYYTGGSLQHYGKIEVDTCIIKSGTVYNKVKATDLTIESGTFKRKEWKNDPFYETEIEATNLTLYGATFESSSVTAENLVFAGGTITITGPKETVLLGSDITAATTIDRVISEADGLAYEYGTTYVRVPAAKKDLMTYQYTGTTYRYPVFAEEGDNYVVKGFQLSPIAVLQVTDRIGIKLRFHKNAVDETIAAEGEFKFGWYNGEGERDIAVTAETPVEYVSGIGFYVVTLPAVGAADFDAIATYDNGFTTIPTSIQSIAELGAELYDGTYRQLFQAIANMGVAANNLVESANEEVPFPDLTLPENTFNLEEFKISRDSGYAIDFKSATLLMGDAVGIRLMGIIPEGKSAEGFTVSLFDRVLDPSLYRWTLDGNAFALDLYINATRMSTLLTIKVDVAGVNCITMTDSVEHLASKLANQGTSSAATWVYTYVRAMRRYLINTVASAEDMAYLNEEYADRVAYHGDAHDHADTGPRSDGHSTLEEWKVNLAALEMDFQAIVDHRQVKHMYLPEWDDSIFIGGSEAATSVKDSKAEGSKAIHYNMIVPNREVLVELLQAFPKFNFNGGKNGVAIEDGVFDYPGYTRAEIQQIIAFLKERGGMFANVHPKQQMKASDPLEYWFADYTGLEIFYSYYGTIEDQCTKDNYQLWKDLLARGKRVWATAGCDYHRIPNGQALTTIYSEQKKAETFVKYMASGDTTCGGVGIRMAMGDAHSGGHTDFAGKRLVFSIGDFHTLFKDTGHSYRMDLVTDQGVVYSQEISCEETQYFAIDADENAAFYRVEIHDNNRGTSLIALGNPIWND